MVVWGPNATVLHYRTNSRRLEDGDLLLIDAGCEYGSYASDVTRTFPVSGRFSKPQRRLYEIVLEAQLAGIAAARPGATLEQIHQVCVRILTQGMIDAELIQGPLDAALEEQRYKRYYMHRTGHLLGMDVHDVGATYVAGIPRPLEPNMVLTVEPGIYVSETDTQAPAEFRGIGIRIEDDVVVTSQEPVVLSGDAPKTVEDVERACAA
jgi:Xaa-Pro aminopeptidase